MASVSDARAADRKLPNDSPPSTFAAGCALSSIPRIGAKLVLIGAMLICRCSGARSAMFTAVDIAVTPAS